MYTCNITQRALLYNKVSMELFTCYVIKPLTVSNLHNGKIQGKILE